MRNTLNIEYYGLVYLRFAVYYRDAARGPVYDLQLKALYRP